MNTLYISVILIILSFSIGAFAHKEVDQTKATLAVNAVHTPEALPQEMAITARSPDAMVQVGEMNLPTLFGEGDAAVNEEQFNALSQVLQQHDLYAEVLITSREGDGFDERQQIGLSSARAMALYQRFFDIGLPSNAVQVLTTESSDASLASVRVRWYRAKSV